MDKPIIGLTLNFRDESRTCRCVASLLSNGAQHVIVWDNSDDEGFCAGNLAKQWLDNDEITILVSPANLGFAAAVNRGIDWIKTKFGDVLVALINNDAEFLPGSLSLLSEALTDRSEILFACSDIDNGGLVTGPTYYQRWFGILSAKKIPGSAPHASGCAMLIAVNRINQPLFDESFFMYGEDAELGWRMARSGKTFAYLPKVLVRHEGSASSVLGSEFYETRMVAAHLILARRLSNGLVEYSVLIFSRLLTLTVRACLRAWRYRNSLPLGALWLGWRVFRGDDPLMRRAKMLYEASRIGIPSTVKCNDLWSGKDS